MNPYQETFETWDKVAQLYQDKFMDLDLYNDTYDAFCAHINNPKASILEIGCGPGNITKYLLSRNPDYKIEGIDVSPNMIALAKTNNPSADFTVMDCREIEHLSKRFDAIMCGFCLPYLSEPDVSKMMRDGRHLLNENGIIYLSFVDGDKNKSGYLAGSSGDRTYFYYHSLSNIMNTLNEHSFEMVNLLHKKYSRNDVTEEVHTIIIAKSR